MSLLTCKDFLSELNEYLDECPDPELRRKVEEHVNECPNCWVIFDTTKRTVQIYRGMEPQTLPGDIESRLLSAIQGRCSQRKRQKQAASQPEPAEGPQQV